MLANHSNSYRNFSVLVAPSAVFRVNLPGPCAELISIQEDPDHFDNHRAPTVPLHDAKTFCS